MAKNLMAEKWQTLPPAHSYSFCHQIFLPLSVSEHRAQDQSPPQNLWTAVRPSFFCPQFFCPLNFVDGMLHCGQENDWTEK